MAIPECSIMSELCKGLTNMVEERGKRWRKHGPKRRKTTDEKKRWVNNFFKKSKQIR